MAIEITNDTVVKLIVRRGQESERLKIVLSEGELGYTIDQARLFVGDGVTPGGHVVGNKMFGRVSTPSDYVPFLKDGDLMYDITKKELVSYAKGTGVYSVHPQVYENSLEKSQNGEYRVSPKLLAAPFSLAYNDSGTLAPTSITKRYNVIDFDSRYLSLCASHGSFYVGNINTRTITNNLSAKLNVQDNIFVNSSVNGYQLQTYAYNPQALGTTFDAISGNLHIRGRDDLTIRAGRLGFLEQPQFTITQGGFVLINPTATQLTYANPGFRVYGLSRIYGNTFVDGTLSAYSVLANDATFNNDVTISGNLSVMGTTTYLDTTVTTTSALSVLNFNENMCAMLVRQGSPTANQTLARFESSQGNNPVVSIKDGPYFGFNTNPEQIFLQGTDTANFCVSGSFFISPNPALLNSRVVIRSGNAGTVDIQAAGNKMVLQNDQRGLELTGSFRATGDSRINGNERVDGNLSVYGTATLGDQAADTINANGSMICNSTVRINGATTMYSPVTIYSSLDVRESSVLGADISDLTTVVGTFRTIGSGTAQIGGDLTVSGLTNLSQPLNVTGNITSTGGLFASTGRIYTNLTVDGQTISNTANITGLLQAGTISAGTTTLGATTINSTLNATAATSTLLNLVVNNTASLNTLNVNSTANVQGAFTTASTTRLGPTGQNNPVTINGNTTINGSLQTNGVISASQDVIAYSTSDVKLKKNIVRIDNALDKVKKLRGIKFEWDENFKTFKGNDIGLVAQEVESIFPEIVATRDNGFKAVRYEKVIPLLVEAIKELSEKIKE